MRSYSTQRPLVPGGCPRAGVQKVHNYDEKEFCEEIGREAWGYVDYDRELTNEEVEDYELLPAGIKKFWAVTTTFCDDGHVVSDISDVVETVRKPEDSFLETKTKDIYVDWFENEEEAKGKIKEALNA